MNRDRSLSVSAARTLRTYLIAFVFLATIYFTAAGITAAFIAWGWTA